MTTPTWFSDERLRSRAKEVVALRAAGLTQREVGQRLGIVQSNVTYIEQQMIGGLGFKAALSLLTAPLDDERARRAQLAVLADLSLNAIQRSALPLAEQVARFQAVVNDLAAEVAKLPETPASTTSPAKKQGPQSPVDGYIEDLRPRRGKATERTKQLKARGGAGAYLADIEEAFGP